MEKGGQNMKENSFAVFEDYKIRRVYDEESEIWYFSVVDIIQVLMQQPDYQAARNYWKVLKNRLNKEGSKSVTKCKRLKTEASDGKQYLIDVADPETLYEGGISWYIGLISSFLLPFLSRTLPC
jgi:DNA-damage-inducible protein D